MTKKFTKWLPYIGLLLALAVLSIANENLIISKKDKIKTLNSDKEKLNRKKFIEIDNHFSDEEKKELENEAYKLGLKPTPPSRIKTINLPKNKEK